VEYIGHGAPWALYVGERHDPGTNVDASNVGQLSGAKLNPNAYIELNACFTGSTSYKIWLKDGRVIERPPDSITIDRP